MRRSERNPRSATSTDGKVEDESASASKKKLVRPNGNSKPGEPMFLSTLPKNMPIRYSSHPHQKPWSSSPIPGRQEAPSGSNPYNRVWAHDIGAQGRWNASLKASCYAAQDQKMKTLLCHDEKHAGTYNQKFWTHMQESGIKAGGFKEKLELVPGRQTGKHLKSGLYKGIFTDVQHKQLFLNNGKMDAQGKKREFVTDVRPAFDNRVKDDVMRMQAKEDSYQLIATHDTLCQRHTRSCTELGADFMNR
jgi:hypothetical protein